MRRTILLVWMLALAGVDLHAINGNIPLHQAGTISVPGHYYLSQDISATDNAFEITVSNVTIDLNNHTVSTSSASGTLFNIITPGVKNIEITGGSLGPCSYGVYYYNSSSNGTIILRNLTIMNATHSAIEMEGVLRATVEDCRISDCWSGVVMTGTVPFTARIAGNVINESGYGGIVIDGMRGGEILDNTISHPGFKGIHVGSVGPDPTGGNIIKQNSVFLSNSTGIEISDSRNLVADNVSSQNASEGIGVSGTGNLISGNVLSGNSSNGLLVGGSRNFIERNHIEGNSGWGIMWTTNGNHSYKNNYMRGNASPTSGTCTGCDGGGNII